MKPTRSQNNTDTTFRSSTIDAVGRSAIGAEQKPQKANPSGFSFPQFEQITISRV